MSHDTIREHLRRRGAGPHVVEGGLPYLVECWELFASDVERGYTMGLDEWRNDVDTREILHDVLRVAGEDDRRAWRRRVREADERVRACLVSTPRCVWGDSNARKHGWNAGRNWWYFLVPAEPIEPLRSELART